MTRSLSCSWCHTINVIPQTGIPICSNCHHRADVARLDCDCPMCFAPMLPSIPPPWPVTEMDALLDATVLDLQAVPNLPPIPPLHPPPYSLEVQEAGWEINLDIGDTCAVLSVDVTPGEEEFGPYIIDRAEYLQMVFALVRLLNTNEKLEVVNVLLKRL